VDGVGRLVSRPGPAHAGPDGLVLAVAAMLSIQAGNIVAMQLFSLVGPLGAAVERVVFGGLALLVVVRPDVRRLRRDDWPHLLLFGALIAGTTICFMQSVDRLALGVAVSIAFLGPLAVGVRHSRTLRELAWPVLGFAGVVLVVGVSPSAVDHGSATGYGFAALNAVLWGAYIVVAGAAGARSTGQSALVVAVAIAALLMLPVGFAAEGWRMVEPRVLVLGACAGLMTVGLAFSLEFEAIRRLSARAFGTVASLEPAVGTVFGLLLLHQHVGAIAAIGVVMVVVASLAVAALRDEGGSLVQNPAHASQPPLVDHHVGPRGGGARGRRRS
jgi:inner membrane transporter RhtA